MHPVSSDVGSTLFCLTPRRQDAKIHIRKSVHDALDAIFHQAASEVKDKAESQTFELQIGEELLRSELSYGFGLYFVVHGRTPSTQRHGRPGERVAYHSPHADTSSMY